MSLIEGGLGRDALGLALGADRRGRRCRGQAAPAARPRRRSGASIRSRRRAAGRRWCAARRARAAAASPCRRRRSASPASAPGRRPPRRAPSTAKPRGLSRSEAILARNLLQESPIETVMPIARSTSAAKPRQRLGRDHAVQARGAGQVHERLVDRHRLDQRRELEHQARAPRARRAHISSMSGGTTLACGHSRRASNIGIAERTPKVRAT